MNFRLTSTELELLLHFEANSSLESLSQALGRDPTVISRQLKKISEKGDYLMKSSRRWKITEAGKKLNQATKDFLLAQEKIHLSQLHITIGSTREFCSRILVPNIESLKQTLGVSSISIISSDGSIESLLLQGKIDLGFDCERPYSPEVRYKQVLNEPISPVVAKSNYKQYKGIKKFKELEKFPHILCGRLNPDAISKTAFTLKESPEFTNDIAIARELCLAGTSWALLPHYVVKEEIKNNKLKVIADISFNYVKFGVWCLRERKTIASIYQKAIQWLNDHDDLLKL